MNVVLLHRTVEAALSFQVVSSGQYTTQVCTSVVDLDEHAMYNPDLRTGSESLDV